MNTQHTLAICELFTPTNHGKTNNSSPNIEGHWMVYTTISLDEFYDNSYNEYIEMLDIRNSDNAHPIKIDIVHIDELETGGEVVGFIKTHFLKLVQRKWKTMYKKRIQLIRQRGSLKSLKERQYTGKL